MYNLVYTKKNKQGADVLGLIIIISTIGFLMLLGFLSSFIYKVAYEVTYPDYKKLKKVVQKGLTIFINNRKDISDMRKNIEHLKKNIEGCKKNGYVDGNLFYSYKESLLEAELELDCLIDCAREDFEKIVEAVSKFEKEVYKN